MKKLTVLAVLVFAFSGTTYGQTQQPSPTPKQSLDVIRTNTELVQTSVMVFDKQGRFVEGLKPEDFRLLIDGQPQPISFLSRITAGTSQERAQLAALRQNKVLNHDSLIADAEERGRTIIFFIDDLHLSAASVQRTRQVITDYLNNQMGPNDEVAIASASGQIGFLQQFTNNKAVLRAAVARLNHRPYTVFDAENITMTEYAALRVEQGDSDALTYFTNQLLSATNFKSGGGTVGPPRGGAVASSAGISNERQSSGMSRAMAERNVKERASSMLKQATAVTTNMLIGLETLMRSSAQFPGRKLVFFVSDGFYLNDRNTGFATKLHDITDAALRAGVVVYALDTRGLGSTIDATSNRSDPDGRLSRANTGEITASQDGLNALAGDTGGKALFNSDDLQGAIQRALNETSNYYLLAWRPNSEEQKSSDFRKIAVNIPSRPELTARLPKGYVEGDRANAARSTINKDPQPDTAKPKTEKTVEGDLRAALGAFAAIDNIPTAVAVSYIDTPNNGPLMTASVQASTSALDYGPDKKQAAVDIAGVVLNDQGKPAASFKTRLTVNPLPPNVGQQEAGVVYTYKTPLGPGLYQVRAAVRDEKSGKVGSSSQWIEIPDLASHRLTLSTMLLRGQTAAPVASKKPESGAATPVELPFSVDRKFSHASQLNFFLFIYNAARGANSAPPDIGVQVQVFRNGQTIVATPVRKLSTAGMTDLARIPYSGQFPLASLPSGRYDLQITITDQVASTNAAQRLSFYVE